MIIHSIRLHSESQVYWNRWGGRVRVTKMMKTMGGFEKTKEVEADGGGDKIWQIAYGLCARRTCQM